MGERDFHRASIRILICFPSSLDVRIISNTHSTLYNIIKSRFGDDAFVDLWMMPARQNATYLRKHFPVLVGYFSRRTWEDFDIVAFSVSIVSSEFIETARIIRDARIPVWSEDRMGDTVSPLIVAGGVVADASALLDGVVDLYMLGMGERLFPILVEECLKGQARDGSVARAKESIVSACQLHRGFYNPKLYHYTSRVVNGALKYTYDGCDISDLRTVSPDTSLPAELLECSDRIRYLSEPGRSHKVSLQVSLGCSGARGTCNFDFAGFTYISTDRGLYTLDELFDIQEEGRLDGIRALNPKTSDYEPITAVYQVREAELWRFTLNNGASIEVTPEHDLVDGEWNIRLARDFRVGDSLNTVLNLPCLFPQDDCFCAPDGWICGGFVAGLFLQFGGYDYRGTPYFSFAGVGKAASILPRLAGTSQILKSLGFDPRQQFYVCGDEGYSTALRSLFVHVHDALAKPEMLVRGFTQLSYGDFLAFLYSLVCFSGSVQEDIGMVFLEGFTRETFCDLQTVLLYYGVPCILTDNGTGVEGTRLVLNCHSLSVLSDYFYNWDAFPNDALLAARESAASHSLSGHYDPSWETRIRRIESVGEFRTYNLTVEPSHLVQCNGYISSSQCHEGSLYGAWRERDRESIRRGIYQAKKSSMGESFNFMSFNGNFLSDFTGLLCDAGEMFYRLTSLQFRTDALAASIRENGSENYLRLLKELGTISVSCLHGSSLVTTKRGLIPIRSVVAGDYVWAPTFQTDGLGNRTSMDFGWHEVFLSLPKGVRPLLKVTTSNGMTFLATADHRFLASEREGGIVRLVDTEAKDLAGKRIVLTSSPDDFVDAHNVLSFDGGTYDRLTPGLALLLGWVCSSGYVRGDDTVDVNFAKSGYLVCSELLSVLDSLQLSHEVSKKGRDGRERKVTIHSPHLVGFLHDVGAMKAGKNGKSVKGFPRVVYAVPQEIQLAFLRGFFASRIRFHIETDKRNSVSRLVSRCLASIPYSMVYGIQRLLACLGFLFRIDRFSIEGRDGQFFKVALIGDCSDFYRRCGFDRYYEFNVPSRRLNPIRYDTVLSVEPFGEEPCFDLTVSGMPYFCANGAVVHNCGLEGLSQRLRDFLNKNLTEEDILAVSDEAFRMKFLRFKFATIFTGYETREDFEEHRELYRQILALRDRHRANTVIMCSSTSLVQFHGTPLYYVPRKSAALEWKRAFAKIGGEDFYFNPFSYLPPMGIRMHQSSLPYDTVIQQVQEDMGRDFLEAAILKPLLEHKFKNGEDALLLSVRDTMREWGISPRAQFLERDFTKHPKQHLRIGYFGESYGKFSNGSPSDYAFGSSSPDFEGHGFCLRTPATESKGSLKSCIACGSCGEIDQSRKAFNLPAAQPHAEWMHTRPIEMGYRISDVRSAFLVNSPSFYYLFLFEVGRRAIGITKEGLVRCWLSKAADYDKTLVSNFRYIKSAVFKGLEFPSWTSYYYGTEACVMGFRDALDIVSFDSVRQSVNAVLADSGIVCVKVLPQQSSDFSIDYILSSVDLPTATPDEVSRWVKATAEPHREFYPQKQPRVFGCPFSYKLIRSRGTVSVLYLMPPKFSLVWSEGTKVWNMSMVVDKVKNWKVHGVFNRAGDGRIVDAVTGRIFVPQGFTDVNQSLSHEAPPELEVECVSS